MNKKILIAGLLISSPLLFFGFQNCSPKDYSEINLNSENITDKGQSTTAHEANPHDERISEIAGVYQGCSPSIHGRIYYDYYKITIDKDHNYIAYYELFNNSTCTGTAINKILFASTVHNIERLSNNQGVKTFEIDIKANYTKVLMQSPGYYPYLNNINECGFADWSATIWKDITGKTCPFLLAGDTFHDTYRSFGQFQYITVKHFIDGGVKYLDVPVPFRKSGDLPADRENTPYTRTSNQSVYLNSAWLN